jgi:1,4-dihydroxy-2-naphthoate octaprenyltransferase
MENRRNNRTLKHWIIATRPWSFTAAIMPVLILWGYLYYKENLCVEGFDVDWLNALMAMPLLIIMQAAGNMISDYYDWKKNVDKPNGPNGVTWIYDGTFDAKEILRYGYVLFGIGVALGLYLLYRSGWEALWIGVVGSVLPLAYPWMKARWMGDLNIFLSFALLPAIGTSFVATGHYHFESLLLVVPIGLLTVSILHANNTRDMHNDAEAGLHTISAFMGGEVDKKIYLAEVALPYLLTFAFCLAWEQPLTLVAVALTLPLALRNVRTMMVAKSSMIGQIPTLDQHSAQVQMAFGLLFAAAYFVSGAIA